MNLSLSVHIGESILENVVAHAEASFPHEACGLLFGHRGAHDAVVQRIKPTRNVTANPMTSFEIDPQIILCNARMNPPGDSELIGFYHSHPDGTSEPSIRDGRQAWPQLLYLIVGVTKGHSQDLGIWHTARTGSPFTRDELCITSAGLTAI